MTLQTLTQPVISTEALALRPLRSSDAGPISQYASDARVAQMTTSIPHPLPPGVTEDFIARAGAPDRVEDVWAVDASASGGAEVMGLISLTRLSPEQSEIGYWIAPVHWGNGIAQRALTALVAANPQGCATLFGSTFQDNPASARVLTACGFAYIGDAEAYSVARGANVPTWTYLRQM
ncbi:GNAT family N-acetyltransferase [Pseudaestuariivita sp.]|uniref:GNAT family N-acetyltransferase n=1 Tax=Pseudaestuariivita sp. TaxID=2211669 RepID=UPI004059E046